MDASIDINEKGEGTSILTNKSLGKFTNDIVWNTVGNYVGGKTLDPAAKALVNSATNYGNSKTDSVII
ncbi:MAG: hypothetical protein ACK44B_05055 [Flavobacteriales bacterium]